MDSRTVVAPAMTMHACGALVAAPCVAAMLGRAARPAMSPHGGPGHSQKKERGKVPNPSKIQAKSKQTAAIVQLAAPRFCP